MNQLSFGSAKIAEAPCHFDEGLLKHQPQMFKFYENYNKKQRLNIQSYGVRATKSPALEVNKEAF